MNTKSIQNADCTPASCQLRGKSGEKGKKIAVLGLTECAIRRIIHPSAGRQAQARPAGAPGLAQRPGNEFLSFFLLFMNHIFIHKLFSLLHIKIIFYNFIKYYFPYRIIINFQKRSGMTFSQFIIDKHLLNIFRTCCVILTMQLWIRRFRLSEK